jgi:nitrite reductase/ring-hydroxylating ferredoxin subunit
MSEELHKVATSSDVKEGEAKMVRIGKTQISLCRVQGEIYAIDDICTHEWACMSDGFVEGEEIECPIHMARFNIKTGKVLSEPATEDLKTYKVEVKGDDVYVLADKKE